MQYLNEGTLVEDYVLDSISRLMGCLRECNTSIKWVMLHTAPGRYRVIKTQHLDQTPFQWFCELMFDLSPGCSG